MEGEIPDKHRNNKRIESYGLFEQTEKLKKTRLANASKPSRKALFEPIVTAILPLLFTFPLTWFFAVRSMQCQVESKFCVERPALTAVPWPTSPSIQQYLESRIGGDPTPCQYNDNQACPNLQNAYISSCKLLQSYNDLTNKVPIYRTSTTLHSEKVSYCWGCG